MPSNVVRFGFVIEGKGEEAALPLLVRRICDEVLDEVLGVFGITTTRPVRATNQDSYDREN